MGGPGAPEHLTVSPWAGIGPRARGLFQVTRSADRRSLVQLTPYKISGSAARWGCCFMRCELAMAGGERGGNLGNVQNGAGANLDSEEAAS